MHLEKITTHYQKQWSCKVNTLYWEGRNIDQLSDLRIIEVPPHEKRDFWTYATVGMSAFPAKKQMELHLFSPDQDHTLLELLVAVAYYHATAPQGLDLWHTLNFGRPWKPHSLCSYGLISLPYLDGPHLERLSLDDLDEAIHFYWLIPITAAEKNFKVSHGVASLEQIFETQGINYLLPNRDSLV